MAFDFPNNPTLGQSITNPSSSQIYTWDGVAWSSAPVTASFALLASTASLANTSSYGLFSLTATSASHALNADNAITSSHALNANQALTSSYINVIGLGVGVNYGPNQLQLTGSTVTISDTAPTDPFRRTTGSLWFNSQDTSLYIAYPDGDSSQWVGVSPAGPVVTSSYAATASYVVMQNYTSYASDVAAAAAGVPLGGIYNNTGILRVRTT